MTKDPSFDSYLDQQIEEHMRDELLEQFPDEQHDEFCAKEGCAQCEEEEEEEEEKRAKIIEAAKADMPRFKAYCKKNNLKVVDNKLVSCEDEKEDDDELD